MHEKYSTIDKARTFNTVTGVHEASSWNSLEFTAWTAQDLPTFVNISNFVTISKTMVIADIN